MSTSKLWHERFGHLNLTSLKEMHKTSMIVDLPEIIDLPDDGQAACHALYFHNR